MLERVTTVAPFPRGLEMVDGKLYVLCRGRVRDAGGVSAEIDDQAGTLYVVDPNVSEPASGGEVGEAVRNNGRAVALPTVPPFRLWDRAAYPPENDRVTDRPYCTLRYHDPSKSFYVCAFSGIDKAAEPGKLQFSKNLSDALFRYDLRTEKWYEVERHRTWAGGSYPHHDTTVNPPPHGWLNGPDNCLAVGRWLYAVGKDNNRLVRYDLTALEHDPEAGCPGSEVVLGEQVSVRGLGVQWYWGPSALAYRDGWLYVGYRTSSVIVRIRLNEQFAPEQPVEAELLARFDPYDPKTGKSANITDIGFDDQGRLYAISASPSRVYRFSPDPDEVYDGRSGTSQPYADFAAMTGNRYMKSENLLCHDGWLYVTSGDGYGYQNGAAGTVYRIEIVD
ncbi:MAG: hypothetical protein ACREID_02670 [Planctomycetota bacterium]